MTLTFLQFLERLLLIDEKSFNITQKSGLNLVNTATQVSKFIRNKRVLIIKNKVKRIKLLQINPNESDFLFLRSHYSEGVIL